MYTYKCNNNFDYLKQLSKVCVLKRPKISPDKTLTESCLREVHIQVCTAVG